MPYLNKQFFATRLDRGQRKVMRTGLSAAMLLSLVVMHLSGCRQQASNSLRVSEVNPRYFTDNGGKAIYLTGSHTWDNLVDMHKPGRETPFDYATYLRFMKEHHHNFMRMWAWELLTMGLKDYMPIHEIDSHPWLRTGSNSAVDGKPRFDLTELNDAYFERLRERVQQAGAQGIYVSVMLFEGWGVQFSEDGYVHHPFHPLNNCNSLGLDSAAASRLVMFTLSNTKVLAVQEAYVRRVVEAVGDLDNVLYEISNENHGGSTAWQYHMIDFVRALEKERGYSHPVGMTFQFKGGTNDALFDSPADWISPNQEGGYMDHPPAAMGTKVLIPDTDHLWGIGGTVQWVWKSFLRGMNPIFMDPYRDSVFITNRDADWEKVRVAMGETKQLADRVDLIHMLPDTTLSTSRYCLAHAGSEYVVYLPDSLVTHLDLSAAGGVFDITWLDTETAQSQTAGPVTGGSLIPLTSPFRKSGSVAHLKRK